MRRRKHLLAPGGYLKVGRVETAEMVTRQARVENSCNLPRQYINGGRGETPGQDGKELGSAESLSPGLDGDPCGEGVECNAASPVTCDKVEGGRRFSTSVDYISETRTARYTETGMWTCPSDLSYCVWEINYTDSQGETHTILPLNPFYVSYPGIRANKPHCWEGQLHWPGGGGYLENEGTLSHSFSGFTEVLGIASCESAAGFTGEKDEYGKWQVKRVGAGSCENPN